MEEGAAEGAVEAAEGAVEVGAEEEERVDAEEEEGGDIWSMKAMIAATLRMILRSISSMIFITLVS